MASEPFSLAPGLSIAEASFYTGSPKLAKLFVSGNWRDRDERKVAGQQLSQGFRRVVGPGSIQVILAADGADPVPFAQAEEDGPFAAFAIELQQLYIFQLAQDFVDVEALHRARL